MVIYNASLLLKPERIKPLLNEPLRLGATWYLIDSHWFQDFKLHLGLEQEDEDVDVYVGMKDPGPIDNFLIFKNGESEPILEKLQNLVDYELVSEQAWNLLVEWYGLADGQQPIARKVIQNGKEYIVEVYLQQLYLCKDFDVKKKIPWKFSSSDTLAKILCVMKEEFVIPEDEPVRLVACHSTLPFDELDDLENTIQNQGLYENQMIVVTKEDDGIFHNDDKSTQSTVTTKSWASKFEMYHNNDNKMVTKTSCYSNMYSNKKKIDNIQPGLCGLTNLGNTCFMNSVLQCMSNCPPITKYFLENQYIQELNEENPLGMEGEIAKSFGELMKVMWSGEHSVTTPHKFKQRVSQFAPQFYGIQQHDSQELLTFLLDGLHEDLNRIKKKPYITLRNSDGRPDNEVAKEAWDNYLKRNDSVIIDFFHGLLKSTVHCPECEKISITFDPFCYLSLPLPIKRERQIDVTLVPNDTNMKLENHRIVVSKDGKFENLAIALSKLTKIDVKTLIFTVNWEEYIHEFFSLNDPLIDLQVEECHAYEMDIHPNDKNSLVVPVVFSEFNQEKLIGLPILITVPRNNCTYEMLTNAIRSKLSRNVIIKNDGGGGGNKSFSIYFFLKHVSDSNDLILIADDGNPIQFPKHLNSYYLVIKWNSDCVKYLKKELLVPEVQIQKPVKLNLYNCFELYNTCEKLDASDGWYCPSCKIHQQATKKFDLWSLPKILIVQLKRFSYEFHRRKKIEAFIDFPLRSLDLSKFIINQAEPVNAMYDLIGVCNHYGDSRGGHYITYAQNKINGKWYMFNDSCVSAIKESEVISSAAYVLFYMRREDSQESLDIN